MFAVTNKNIKNKDILEVYVYALIVKVLVK